MSRDGKDTGPSLAARVTARREVLAAWTVWALMLTAGLWFVAAYAFTMPYGDEWAWLPVAAGQEPPSLSWFWSLHNEHRMVLPRLIYLGLGWLTAFDFRAGSFFNIIALGGLAAAMMLTARSLRGRTSVYDAFFPLLLLHWAQCENIVWGFQLNFITSVVLVGIILMTIVRCGQQIGLPSALIVTVCLVGLGLCGLYGLAYLPALACWLTFAGVIRCRADIAHARRDGALLVALGGVPLVVTALYFVGFHPCNDRPPDIWAIVRTTVQFLSSGIGPAAKEIWPVSGVLVAVACGYALWQLYTVFLHQPQERVRAAGLFCFLGGIGSLALAIGVGRAFEGPRAGFMERYMTLAAPLLCLFYFQFTLYCTKAKIHLQRTLCLLMLGLMVVNVPKGLRYAHYFDHLLTPLAADMRAGLAPADLALRHGEDLAFAPDEVFAARLEMLRRAHLGPYREAVDATNLTIQHLSRLIPSRDPSETRCLLPGQRATQHFDVPAGTHVSRIDVKISRCRRRRTADRLDWELYVADPGKPRVLVSRGAVNMRSIGQNDYVSLPTHESPLRAPTEGWSGKGQAVRASRFALVFSLPVDTPEQCGVDLPLYRCTGTTERAIEIDATPQELTGLSLKGFVYLAH